MFGRWDVRDVGCSGGGIFGMWGVWDVGCWGCGMFGMWDVGCLPGCGMLIYKMPRCSTYLFMYISIISQFVYLGIFKSSVSLLCFKYPATHKNCD